MHVYYFLSFLNYLICSGRKWSWSEPNHLSANNTARSWVCGILLMVNWAQRETPTSNEKRGWRRGQQRVVNMARSARSCGCLFKWPDNYRRNSNCWGAIYIYYYTHNVKIILGTMCISRYNNKARCQPLSIELSCARAKYDINSKSCTDKPPIYTIR